MNNTTNHHGGTTMSQMFEVGEANEWGERKVAMSGEVIATVSEQEDGWFVLLLLTDDLNEEPGETLEEALEILAEMVEAATDED